MTSAVFAGFLAAVAATGSTVENAAPADELARQKFKAEIPSAPEGYRRPKDFKPVLYKRDLHMLAREESAEHIARAKALMARVDETNRKGKWHADARSIDAHRCPEWFVDAKLGIFIDWGPWSMASWCPYKEGARLYPDWYEYRCDTETNHVAYHEKNWGKDFKRDHFLDLFRAEKFDAPAMMRVFRECGAKYVVPFLKHHAGYCLWDSSFTFRDSADQGAHRDLAKEMAEACRAEGMKFGMYTSQAGEWEYPILRDDGTLAMFVQANPVLKPYAPEYEWKASGKVAVRDFVREYLVPQTVEFIDKYDPDIIWGDYDWASEAAKNGSYDIAAYFYNHAEGRKEVAVNDRMGRGTSEEESEWRKIRKRLIGSRTLRGDFYTDEWGDTAADIDPAKWHPWESCSGISKAYGNHWMEREDMVMSEAEFVCHFADIVARGGNLLLLVNLDPQGAMVEHQRKRLEQIGKWLKTNGEAIYGTRICHPFATKDVDYTRSKDGGAVYAIVKRGGREVTLRCELKAGTKLTLLDGGEALKARRTDAGMVVEVPESAVRSWVPFVIKCELPKVVVEMPGRTPKENAAAVQAAIDGCAAAGGGRVEIPEGEWVCATIRLRSEVELHLRRGAVLKASADLADYNAADEYPENWGCAAEGWSARHFIIAHRVTGASITGEGVIDGNANAFFEGEPVITEHTKIVWAKGYRRKKNMDNPALHRPGQLIVFVKSKDVRVEGITIRQAPCWSLFFHGCDGVTVRDYTVRNGECDGNTDGIDIDCSSNVLVERADIRTGDDAIAIRASNGRLGEDKACENVRIRDCDLSAYAMGIRIGVGNGLICKVDIENVRVHHAAWGVSFDCWYGAKAKAGVDVEDVTIGKSRFDGCYEAWRFRLGGERQEFGVRRVRFEDCVFTSPRQGSAAYCGDRRLEDVVFDRCVWSPAADNPFNSVVNGEDLSIQ